jgi:beta-ring hydroxylase
MFAAYRRDHPNVQALSSSAVRQFRDEIKTFMLAGHETSAAMMTWTLYELMHNPFLVQKLVEEGKSVWKKETTTNSKEYLPTPDELSTLELAESCLKESLRKYSVVPVAARLLTKDLAISGYLLPKGSSVLIDIVGVHLDPNLWPKPLQYDPYRFYRKVVPPLTFLPFIAGPRNCLGQNLALLESKMVISLLLQKYKFQLIDQVSDTSDWSGGKNPCHRFMVPVIPKQEVMLVVEKVG